MSSLYPQIQPSLTHQFTVGGHTLHVEESGFSGGIPILFLHGGPGAGCKPHHHCFFDPSLYRIILVDQRGSGLSGPQGSIDSNTTEDLLNDLEIIRGQLNVDAWVIFGGSWGATLALLYAQRFPLHVRGLILRGVFLARMADMEWFTGETGVRRMYPDAWEHLRQSVDKADRDQPVAALYRMLTGPDELARRRAARAWEQWGGQVVLGNDFNPSDLDAHVPGKVVNQARIELHFALHHHFLAENAILSGCHRIPEIPIDIIHGRQDLVCPVESAWALHQHLPGSSLTILPDSGHAAIGDEMISALVVATDRMAQRLAGSTS